MAMIFADVGRRVSFPIWRSSACSLSLLMVGSQRPRSHDDSGVSGTPVSCVMYLGRSGSLALQGIEIDL